MAGTAKLSLRITQRPNVQVLAGTAAGQVIALGTLPLVLTQYDVATFGRFVILVALASPLTALATMRYELAIPISSDATQVAALARLSVAIATILCSVAGLAGICLTFTADAGGTRAAAGLGVSFIALMVWSTALFQVCNQLAVRQRDYKSLALRGIAMSTVTVCGQLILATISHEVAGLVFGYTLGQAAAALMLWHRNPPRARATLEQCRDVASLNSAFPRQVMPAGLLNGLSLHAPALMIGQFYGASAAGQYGLAQRVLAAPVNLIAQSVGSVFLTRISEFTREVRDERARTIFLAYTKRLAMIATVTSACAILLGPAMIAAFFGPDWSTAGYLIQILAIMTALQLVASPLSQVLVVTRHTVTLLLCDLGRLASVSGALIAGTLAGSDLGAAVTGLAVASTVTYGLIWYANYRVLE